MGQSLGRWEGELKESIDEGAPGFRGGFVSSIAARETLRQTFGKDAPKPQLLGKIIRELGYMPCPGLAEGKATRNVPSQGNKRPKIFVTPKVAKMLEGSGTDLVTAFEEAQREA